MDHEKIANYVNATNLAASSVSYSETRSRDSMYPNAVLTKMSNEGKIPPFDGDAKAYLPIMRKALSDLLASYCEFAGDVEYYRLEYTIIADVNPRLAFFREGATAERALCLCTGKVYVHDASLTKIEIMRSPLGESHPLLSEDVLIDLLQSNADKQALAALQSTLLTFDDVLEYGWAVQTTFEQHQIDSTMLFEKLSDALLGAKLLKNTTAIDNPVIKPIKGAGITHADFIQKGESTLPLQFYVGHLRQRLRPSTPSGQNPEGVPELLPPPRRRRLGSFNK
jgi:hypothetical protein